MTYRAPLADIKSALRHAADIDGLQRDGLFIEATPDLVDAVLEEAGRFAEERIAPLNQPGDKAGARFENGNVTTAPGWRETYADWSAAGWNALRGPPGFGGQGLPVLLNAACIEMWNSASMAFGLAPLLNTGAVEALAAHGSEALRAVYLPKLVSGQWTGTMAITEPQAGSDLSTMRIRAERQADGSYRIFGHKIFISYGEHDLTENIVHLVLARLPDAPAGTRGISLFLVPKFLVAADGSLGTRNDAVCTGIEHKLGIRASPTCSMAFGDQGGAVGYLVGEENRGLACMFTMMNNARLGVSLQGVAIAERATQQAFAFAKGRRQGRAAGMADAGMSPIIEHPDVRRMLAEMRAKTAAARALCYQLAEAIDRGDKTADAVAAKRARDHASLLTPVAKAFATDIGSEVASLGVQVHGGMGFVEETGAAQHLRDARIAAIYEGTNGIQAIDLVTRKLPLDDGRAVGDFIDGLREDLRRIAASNAGLAPITTQAGAAVDALDRATGYMLEATVERPTDALAGATPYLRLFALAAGATALLRQAQGAISGVAPDANRCIDIARFFASQLASGADGLARAIMDGAEALGSNFDDPA